MQPINSQNWSQKRSPPNSQRGPRMNHACHHCGIQGHTRPNCHQLRALNNTRDQRSRGPRNNRRNWAVTKKSKWRARCDERNENDWGIYYMFGKLQQQVWRSQFTYPILWGYHPKCTWCVGEEGYSCMTISYVHASILPMLRIIGLCIISCITFFL